MVQQSQYGGNATEDSNSHLSTFLEICDTINFNGVSDDAIKLRLFLFSLRDKAKVLLQSHPPNTFTTWAELAKAFLNKFFSPEKTAKVRMDITSFSQQEGETLYETWEGCRELQRRCPHHDLPDWLIVQTLYNGLTFPTKTHVDATAGEALMGKSAEEAQQLIEEMVANNYQWANERDNTRRTASMLEVDTLNMLSAKIDNVVEMLNRQVGSSSNQGVVVAYCTNYGGDHDDSVCSSSEQVQYLNNYNRPPQNNLYSNTYNLGWRNHPNFGWKDQGNQQRATNPPGFQSRQPQEKLAKVTSDRFERVEGRLDQLAGMYRNLEVQVGQIANMINNRNPGELPSKIEVNPIEYVNTITLRSGKTVEGPNFENSGGEKDKEQSIEGEKESRNDHIVIDIDALPPKLNFQLNSNVIPFPHRLKKDGQDREFEKFFKMFKQLHINIPFIDAITQIPSYARFLKDIMSRKRKIVDNEMIALTEECSALIKNKLPPKLKDPGSFSIPCTIGQLHFSNAICDLGASVSLLPLSVARRLGLQELKVTNITLQLVDQSITHPKGILENVLIKARKSIIPVDFVVLDIEEDVRMPIILGRPFLATARTIIDVEKGKLILRVNGEKLEFNLDNKEGSIEPTALVSNMPTKKGTKNLNL
ncbi:uncharacterized protein [Coffea arabica]|uniref:Retrotransposon gag domain-containing protein n=1 Tax=Coffea arabica TaxID=13443 RepID=A0A6P6WZ79_COFAR|nr:uncharacterized protein LOC113737644 [Coffea arabica]